MNTQKSAVMSAVMSAVKSTGKESQLAREIQADTDEYARERHE